MERGSRKALLCREAGLVLLVLIAILSSCERSPADARAGDCVARDDDGSVRIVDCDSEDADYELTQGLSSPVTWGAGAGAGSCPAGSNHVLTIGTPPNLRYWCARTR